MVKDRTEEVASPLSVSIQIEVVKHFLSQISISPPAMNHSERLKRVSEKGKLCTTSLAHLRGSWMGGSSKIRVLPSPHSIPPAPNPGYIQRTQQKPGTLRSYKKKVELLKAGKAL